MPLGDLAAGTTATIGFAVNATGAAFCGHHTVSVAAASPMDPSPNLASAIIGGPAVADLRGGGLTYSDASGNWIAEVINRGPDTVSRYRVTDRPDGGGKYVDVSVPLAPGAADLVDLPFGYHQDLTAYIRPDPQAPYCETDRSNNGLWATHWGPLLRGGKCGLTGIEAPLLLGLLGLLRGTRRLRSRRRALRGAFSTLVLVLLLSAAAAPSRATPITFAVDAVASSATFSLASPLGSPAPVAVSLSGTTTVDVTLASDALFGSYAASLQLAGGAIALSDASILLDGFPLYSLTFASAALAAGLSGPPTSGFASSPGLSVFSMSGALLSFDTGTVSVMGDYYGLPVSESLDLAALPFAAYFSQSSVGQARVSDLGGGQAAIELTIPFSAPLRLYVDGAENTLTFAGTLALTGVVVLEPTPACLIGAGAMLLLCAQRLGAGNRSSASAR